ncbi:protein RALF-like 17 [Raphanus sativus]|uniref:Protein RALF-like 17 n=1 Tax=Raphanus sativus TaxID=3726 RepID=A0A6J0NDX1_RAPSA|nr:protein RALF-like 17 [Raphanus sativus]
MAASREFIICCLLTLLLCTFFMRIESGAADITRKGCGGGDGSLGDDNERCVEAVKEHDDNDVDDVFKVINKLRIYA